MAKKASPNKTSLAHHFLVALPSLEDPSFSKSVIYLYEHNEEGAMGLIINKPLNMQLKEVLQHLNIPTALEEVATHSVLMGGPVSQEHGFVLYEEGSELFLSSSKDTLIDIANGRGSKQYLITLGYAGWQTGQLEIELQRNDWLIIQYEREILFSIPSDKRWQAAAQLIGVISKKSRDNPVMLNASWVLFCWF